MKRFVYLAVCLATMLSVFPSCDDEETYAEQKEREKNQIMDYIARNNIQVIELDEFLKDTVTDVNRNEYVLFSDNGVYMQIVKRGEGRITDMSLKAVDKNGCLVYIDKAIPGDYYYCQICGQPMLQRRGDVRIHHFSHYSPHGHSDIVPCSDNWGYDKTEWHMEWQKRFPVDNMERVLELNGKKHIADVLVENVVVEFQHSPISLDEFNERNEFYTNLGHKVDPRREKHNRRKPRAAIRYRRGPPSWRRSTRG